MNLTCLFLDCTEIRAKIITIIPIFVILGWQHLSLKLWQLKTFSHNRRHVFFRVKKQSGNRKAAWNRQHSLKPLFNISTSEQSHMSGETSFFTADLLEKTADNLCTWQRTGFFYLFKTITGQEKKKRNLLYRNSACEKSRLRSCSWHAGTLTRS